MQRLPKHCWLQATLSQRFKECYGSQFDELRSKQLFTERTAFFVRPRTGTSSKSSRTKLFLPVRSGWLKHALQSPRCSSTLPPQKTLGSDEQLGSSCGKVPKQWHSGRTVTSEEVGLSIGDFQNLLRQHHRWLFVFQNNHKTQSELHIH
ncbi:uncharacterized protein V6R79_019785 [Siganus canaliculatus]